MGQRFQCYVNYGKQKAPGEPGENLFAMHLQWCWGQYSIVRAHQLVDFLDGARGDIFNPFGMGEHSRVGGSAFDGRREDLYILNALTEINTLASTIVPGHDLMAEELDYQKWLLGRGELTALPSTIRMDPLAQDNNDGFLVVQAAKEGIRYAFCKDVCAIDPVSASEYLQGYREEWWDYDEETRASVEAMAEKLDGYPLLSKEEMERIFEREYDKKLNIEGYREPEHPEPLNEVVREAKDRAERQRPLPDDQANEKDNMKRSDPAR